MIFVETIEELSKLDENMVINMKDGVRNTDTDVTSIEDGVSNTEIDVINIKDGVRNTESDVINMDRIVPIMVMHGTSKIDNEANVTAKKNEEQSHQDRVGTTKQTQDSKSSRKKVMSRLIWKHVEDEQKKEREVGADTKQFAKVSYTLCAVHTLFTENYVLTF